MIFNQSIYVFSECDILILYNKLSNNFIEMFAPEINTCGKNEFYKQADFL